MNSILFDIPLPGGGVLPVYSYGFMIMVGFGLGVWVGVLKAARQGVSVNDCLDLAMVLLVSGILGGRALYVIQFHEQFAGDFGVFAFFDIFGEGRAAAGLGLYAAGGVAGYFIARRFYQGILTTFAERRQGVAQAAGKKKGKKNKAEVAALKLPDSPLVWGAGFALSLFVALVFARALYVIVYRAEYSFAVFDTRAGGMVVFGALIPAVLCGIVFVWIRRLPVLMLCDCAAPSVALGMAYGRVGCFLNGCCWGDVVKEGSVWQPLAVEFPKRLTESGALEGSPAYVDHLGRQLVTSADAFSLPVIPTQILYSLNMAVIFFVLTWFYRRGNRREGDVMLLLGLLYSAQRFVIEILRDDNVGQFDGLTLSQNIAIAVFLACIGLFFVNRRFFKSPQAFARGGGADAAP